MTRRAPWATTACALPLLMLMPLMQAGCGEIDNCKVGEDGCLGGLPLEDLTCRYDLVLDTSTGVCTEPDDVTGGDDDDDAIDGPPLPNPCKCTANQVCQTDGSCVDLCLVPNAVVNKPSFPQCRSTSYSFQEAAIAGCQQACGRRAAICGEACDPATACSAATALAWLAAVDPACAGNTECAMKRCEEVRDRPCAAQACLGGGAPNCTNVTCENNCVSDGESFNLDGVCDDGDLSNAVSAICRWGSDCGDCGPRRGPAPAAVKKLGEQCIDPYQCGAPYADFSAVPGWCVPLDDSATLEHCVPDCTMPPHSCPESFDCQRLRFTDESGKEENIRDNANNVARACFPTQCGG
ncbi:MAG: hypothetical protein ABW252_08815 [Polyangiales bacterium]